MGFSDQVKKFGISSGLQSLSLGQSANKVLGAADKTKEKNLKLIFHFMFLVSQ